MLGLLEAIGMRPGKNKEDATMSEEKKTAVTEEVKEARKLSMEGLEKVTGGSGGLVQPSVSLSPPTSEELSSNKS